MFPDGSTSVLSDTNEKQTASQQKTNQSEEEEEKKEGGRRRRGEEEEKEGGGSRGAYLSTNCYILVDTAVKKRQRVRSSRERNSKQQSQKKVKEMLPEETSAGRRNPAEETPADPHTEKFGSCPG